jgi:WD40 repeat protein
VINALTTF